MIKNLNVIFYIKTWRHFFILTDPVFFLEHIQKGIRQVVKILIKFFCYFQEIIRQYVVAVTVYDT